MRAERVLRFSLLLTFTVVAVMGMTVSPVMAASQPSALSDLNYDGDQDAPDPYGDATLTVAKHPVENLSDGVPQGYFDDNGDWVSDPIWEANETSNLDTGDNVNPYTFDPAKVEDDSNGAFPRRGTEEEGDSGDNQASVLDSSEWKVNRWSSNVTLSDTTIAQNVDAISIDTTPGQSDEAYVTEVGYSNWTSQLDSSETKLVLIISGDITTFGNNAHANLSIVDESGDKKVFHFDNDVNYDKNASMIQNQTGTFTYQVALSSVATEGGGSFDNIEHINISVRDGEFDMDISRFDLEKKSKMSFGQEAVDTAVDSDTEKDQLNHTYNSSGTITIQDLSAMDSEFDDAEITDLKFPVRVPVSRIDGEEGTEHEFLLERDGASDFPNYDHVLNTSYRLEFPSAIDLTWSNLNIRLDQEWPSGRYVTLSIHEGASGSNLTAVSLTDKTGNLGDKGDNNIQLDDGSVSVGTEYVIKVELKVTDDEWDRISAMGDDSTPTPEAGGGGGPIGGGLGFLGGLVMNPVTWVTATIGGIVQFVRGGWPFSGG